MTKEHTKGPWVYSTGSVYLAEPKDAQGYPCVRLAVRDSDEAGISPTEKDAALRLMAAAPEMLAVVERCAAHFEGTDAPLGIAARAALAKVSK